MKGIVLSFVSILVCAIGGSEIPPKCCAPEAFEVEIHASASSMKGTPEEDKQYILFVYEAKKKHWALTVENKKENQKSTRIVADHEAGRMSIETSAGCWIMPLTAEFAPFCIQENATFFGDYSYGREGHSLPFEVWGYNIDQAPMRLNSKVSKEHCIPLQDDVFYLTAGNFQLTSHNKPCNPWEKPEMMANGDCFRCLYKIPIVRKGPVPAYHVTHMQYNNFFRGLHRVPRFDMPSLFEHKECKEVDTWDPDVVQLSDIQKFFILRMKK